MPLALKVDQPLDAVAPAQKAALTTAGEAIQCVCQLFALASAWLAELTPLSALLSKSILNVVELMENGSAPPLICPWQHDPDRLVETIGALEKPQLLMSTSR